jgi:hypothetical protein
MPERVKKPIPQPTTAAQPSLLPFVDDEALVRAVAVLPEQHASISLIVWGHFTKTRKHVLARVLQAVEMVTAHGSRGI